MTPLPPAVLLIALSARPYVQALKEAGYCTIVIDGFLDQETRFFADEAYQVVFDGLGFDSGAFQAQFTQLIHRHVCIGCLYGAGLEAQPELLNLVKAHMPVLGNPPKVLQSIKAPDVFFQKCAATSIAFPPWQFRPPKLSSNDRWLRKTIGGAGGNHIQFAKPTDQANEQDYFQKAMEGETVSVLFLSTPRSLNANAIILGVHTQWAAATDATPYRLGGLVALDELDSDVEHKLQIITQKLTAAFDLIGLNALDVIVQGGEVFVLELNPRLSLSLDLYLQDYNRGAQVNLLALHLLIGLFIHKQDSMLKERISHALAKLMAYHMRSRSSRLFKAIAIVYAPVSFDLNKNVLWPEWVVDRPAQAGKIELNSPVCSVFALAQTTALAKERVLKRVEAIKQNAELISSN